jgi:hypothetical protein
MVDSLVVERLESASRLNQVVGLLFRADIRVRESVKKIAARAVFANKANVIGQDLQKGRRTTNGKRKKGRYEEQHEKNRADATEKRTP